MFDQELFNSLLLDSRSNTDMVGNKNFTDGKVWDIDPVPVGSNGGGFVMHQATNVTNYGKTKFKEGLLANIHGLCNVVKKFWVQFNSKYANAFFVHTKMGVLSFECNE